MKIAAITDGNGDSWIGRVEDGAVHPIAAKSLKFGADALRDLLADDVDLASASSVADPVSVAECRWLPPITDPQKIIAVALNYMDHAKEAGLDLPKAPMAFTKTPNSLIGANDDIVLTKGTTDQVDYEVELAVIIGRRTRNVTEEEAAGSIFGFTVLNDVSARDAQFADKQWFRGKSFDTFCPTGPWVVTADEIDDPQNLDLSCKVNGTALQDSSTSEMIFGVGELVSYFSRFMTLEPGDIIATGTPHGVGFARTPAVFLQDGDTLESIVENVGSLSNPVVELTPADTPLARNW